MYEFLAAYAVSRENLDGNSIVINNGFASLAFLCALARDLQEMLKN